MSKPVLKDIMPADTAVSLAGVTKTFEQWLRSGKLTNTLKNLLHPQKKIITALDEVSFTVRRGEFVAYAGPNGAGKSTTIKLLGGMLVQNSGRLSVLGLSPVHQRIPLMRKTGILFGNRTELWWDHPVATSYNWKRKVWNIPDGVFVQMEALVLELLDIRPFYHTYARELSLGQRMRADLGMMLLHRPELILLDEPTLGLDVLAKRQMIGFLKKLNREEGTTIVVTSHDMDDLEEMAQRILLLSQGKVAFDGDFSQLRKFIGCGKEAVVTLRDGRQEVYEYADTQEMLKRLAAMRGVEDVAFRQAPLEQALADLFSRWSAG